MSLHSLASRITQIGRHTQTSKYADLKPWQKLSSMTQVQILHYEPELRIQRLTKKGSVQRL